MVEAVKLVQGTYGIVVVSSDQPDLLVGARNGSPLVIGIGNDKLWKEFCKAIGREDLLEIESCRTNVSRVQNNESVKKIVEEHGGRISIENSANGGARIYIGLPLIEEA